MDGKEMWAEVTPLSPTAQITGTLLGLGVVAASIFLYLHQRGTRSDSSKNSCSPSTKCGNAGSCEETITLASAVRMPATILMGLCGLAILGGVWVDPSKYPIAFLATWLTIILLMSMLFIFGGHDLLVVRRSAQIERQKMLDRNRQEIYQQIQLLRGHRIAPGENREKAVSEPATTPLQPPTHN